MKRVVLVGGGHTHIEVLRRAARRRFDAEVVLVDPHPVLPYTGMVPGYVAGHYGGDDILIDLDALCSRAGVTRLTGRACGLDVAARRVTVEGGARLDYDLVSLDIGSVIDTDVPGAAQHALPVRPLWGFVQHWQATGGRKKNVAVVGAGAGGVELALALRTRLGGGARITLVGDEPIVASGWPHAARTRLMEICRSRDIVLQLGQRVTHVTAQGLECNGGHAIVADTVVWATGPSAPAWLADTSLTLDERGYVTINTDLRAEGLTDVFAAGDVAGIVGHPRPKSGVYAVRAGPVLAANLRLALSGRPLRAYVPQSRALALLGTADGEAIGVYGQHHFAGRWAWHWKQAIDRRFVARYRSPD